MAALMQQERYHHVCPPRSLLLLDAMPALLYILKVPAPAWFWCLAFLLRTAVKLLASNPNLSSLKLDFIPWITRQQLRSSTAAAARSSGGGTAAAAAAHNGSSTNLSRQQSGGSIGSYTSGGELSVGGLGGGGGGAAADGVTLPRHLPGEKKLSAEIIWSLCPI